MQLNSLTTAKSLSRVMKHRFAFRKMHVSWEVRQTANNLSPNTIDVEGGFPLELRTILLAAMVAMLLSPTVFAQDDTEKAIEKYRQMLKEDPWSNPGLLDADRGEALWGTARG